MADFFEDARGRIMDWVVRENYAVTHITNTKGAVRGNHYHKQTDQFTYIVSGRLRIACFDRSPVVEVFEAGRWHWVRAGVAHAWEALEDSEVIVFVVGPRAGDQYESDTFRLETPLLPLP